MKLRLSEKLSHIQSNDPDGGMEEPTQAMYKAHKDWAIRLYGEEVWKLYIDGNWETLNG